MRLERTWTNEIKDPFDLDLYFCIYKKHAYVPMLDRDFCAFCHHSAEFHLKNGIDTKELGDDQ